MCEGIVMTSVPDETDEEDLVEEVLSDVVILFAVSRIAIASVCVMRGQKQPRAGCSIFED
jgi:hypothetical protein